MDDPGFVEWNYSDWTLGWIQGKRAIPQVTPHTYSRQPRWWDFDLTMQGCLWIFNAESGAADEWWMTEINGEDCGSRLRAVSPAIAKGIIEAILHEGFTIGVGGRRLVRYYGELYLMERFRPQYVRG